MARDKRPGARTYDGDDARTRRIADKPLNRQAATGSHRKARRIPTPPPAHPLPLTRRSSPVPPRQVDVQARGMTDGSFSGRYEVGDTLGEGSMGTVALARDTRIGREVALKRMHPLHERERPDLRERFLREVRVQGQLEHPALVPVYDLGVDSEGRAYFTMKRVRGHTLEEIIEGLQNSDPDFLGTYSRRKLLTAISRICLAIAFAHERGVVHRDLKPANIMLGDYGEVHVLDWGIAQAGGEPAAPGTVGVDVSLSGSTRTQTGFVVGSPGYMAPEQARGENDTYGGRSDIYSLGAILFEVLTLQRLHRTDDLEKALLSTVSGVDARPSVRAPERGLPLAFDPICSMACALNPMDRYATARALNDDLEQVLDGDRDARRRQELADTHARNAERALVVAHGGGPEAVRMHRKAVGELLSALALDPEHGKARSTMVRLLLEPAERLPTEAFQELQAVNRNDRARAAREHFWASAGWLLIIPLTAWMGVRNWVTLGVLMALIVALATYNLWMGRTGRTEPRYMAIAVFTAFAVVGAMSTLFGPLFFVPAVAVGSATSILVAIRASRRAQALVLAGSLAAVLVPPLLELMHVIPPSYNFVDGTLQVLPGLTELPPRATWAFLLLANAWTVVQANILVGRAVEALTRAERRLFTQAWRLRQFLPAMGEAAPARRDSQV